MNTNVAITIIPEEGKGEEVVVRGLSLWCTHTIIKVGVGIILLIHLNIIIIHSNSIMGTLNKDPQVIRSRNMAKSSIVSMGKLLIFLIRQKDSPGLKLKEKMTTSSFFYSSIIGTSHHDGTPSRCWSTPWYIMELLNRFDMMEALYLEILMPFLQPLQIQEKSYQVPYGGGWRQWRFLSLDLWWVIYHN